MIEIHNLLHLRSNAPREEIKNRYYKQLFRLHPSTKATGNEARYMELQEAYKRFLRGDSFANCYLVCTNEEREVKCRCGGIYAVREGFEGQIDCDFCSCFIEVEEAARRVCAS